MKRSDEERKAWREGMNRLIKQVGAMSEEEREQVARRLALITCEGHPLSMFNACFLTTQTRMTLTVVAGFQQWRKAGRTVRQGERAAGYIYVPTGKRRSDDEDAPSTPDEKESIRFMLVPVFDVSQTDALEAAVAA